MTKIWPLSIRIQLTMWYSAVLACSLIVFALAIWVSLEHRLYEDLQGELGVRTASLETFITSESKEPGNQLEEELEEYAHGLPEGTYFWLFDQANAVLFASDPSFARPAGQVLPRAYSPWRFWSQPLYQAQQISISPGGRALRIEGFISAGGAIGILRRLRILLLSLTPAVLMIAAFGGFLLSGRALQPVDRITQAAALLSIRDLSVRLPVAATGDELQRLSETWNSMLDRLENAVARLGRFTQDASHELRTPLAIIRSTAELACRRPRSSESYQIAFQQIVEECDRLTSLVEDLLMLARSDQPSRPTFERLSLSALVTEACGVLKILADAKGIQLDMECTGCPILVEGNRPLLQRLLIVLVDNAIKYSPGGSVITVHLARREHSAELQVADCGIGISEEDMAHIFERFYRGEAAREAWGNGAGLGLSLAASIAAQHNATIVPESKAGQGSAFTVTFPLLVEAATPIV